VLFGTVGASDDEEVQKIIDAANAMDAEDDMASAGDYRNHSRGYEHLLAGLKAYPNNMKLLREVLWCSVNRARLYHWEGDARDTKAYAEAERAAKLLISYGDLGDALFAHRWLVNLYPEFGDFDKAEPHAAAFPDSFRGGFDLNRGTLTAALRVRAGDIDGSVEQLRRNGFSLLLVFHDQLRTLGAQYLKLERYTDAVAAHEAAIRLRELICGGEYTYTPLQQDAMTEYAIIAHCYFKLGEAESAFANLEKLIGYHLTQEKYIAARAVRDTPLMLENESAFPEPFAPYGAKRRILRELGFAMFDEIREDTRFRALLERVNALPE
jgi:tetratricopeptide (TPR) repeat protein